MNYCDTLPMTGLDANLSLLLTLVIAMLAAGTVALVFARSRRAGGVAAVLVLLLAGAGLSATPAQAATSDCVTTAENSLTIVQTSTMEGLAPGVAPVAITGLITNNGPDSTFINAIDVAITSVTTAPGSTGTCDASDYVLLRTRMLVERTLGPGGSTPFAGAAIGFSDKTTNQDACQRATIHLLYTTVPDA